MKGKKEFNPANYGLTLQKLICDHYGIEATEKAALQFDANYNEDFADELRSVMPLIEKETGSKPVKLLTFSSEMIRDKQMTSPHNFLLANGRTLSLRTTKGSGMIAPRTVGQAGYDVLNDHFAEIFGCEVDDQKTLREMMFNHIHEVLPIFIEYLFPSDITIFIERDGEKGNTPKISTYKISDIADYSFERNEFTFTRGLDEWEESTTLKYHGVSIAELQTHKNRTFKFRFKIKAIPQWFQIVKETTETFGITAEAAICRLFNLDMPDNFKTRVSKTMLEEIAPVVKEAFLNIPKAIKHTGSEGGERGSASKCSYDFLLEDNLKLSLKTNAGNKVCPPEVGQPGSATALLYFKDFLPGNIDKVDGDSFKQMVMENIERLIPIYLSHLFDSDWLLWIYKTKSGYKFEAIHQNEISIDFHWDRAKFSFTKPTLEEWNESNTLKYDGVTIGEFQVHHHRNSFKFRFHMPNLLKLLRNK